MLDFLFHSTIAWIGMGGVAVLICGAVAWFFPPLRTLMIEIAGGILAAAAIYAKGNRDEAAKWNDAIKKDVSAGNKARTDAERGVADGSVRGTEWDRDARGM